MIYDLLMKAAAETTLTIATDPKHLDARIGITAVQHTWGTHRQRSVGIISDLLNGRYG